MDIIKNDQVDVVRSMSAKIEKTKNKHFTHLLKIKHNPVCGNMDCKRVNDLVESHFDTLCDNVKSEDIYKIIQGGVDSDGDSGFFNESVIDDIEHLKNEMVDNQIYVVFRIKLSKNKELVF